MKHNAYRDGRVHVCAAMCPTCVFRPGNLMQLRAGRVRQMVDEALENGSAIICHKTLEGDNAVCRGFFERWPTQPLQVGERLGLIRWVDP
jgi:hypothetical protein